MDAIQQRQQEIIEAIKQIERNFGKDSSSRKTRKYINDRLDILDKYWAEFQSLQRTLELSDSEYDPHLAEEELEKTRKYVDSLRMKIASFPLASETSLPSKSTLKQSDTMSLPVAVESKPPGYLASASTSNQNMAERASDLLSLQHTNFRAFIRLTNSLRLDEINEKWVLEDELKNLQTRWATIDNLHLQIDNILQGSNKEYDGDLVRHEALYKTMKRLLNKKLASTAHTQQSTPRIEIPIFHGNYTQWPTFYDLYMESIHNNSSLTSSQKMQHLKGKLRGEAERLVMHLNITSENYNTAWELLKNRYNNPQLLFKKQIELFLNQPTVQKQSAFEIKRLFDNTSECLHGIQNLGVNIDNWDPLLVHLIAKKLDSATYSDYKEAQKSPRDLPKLSELMEFLEAKFLALEPIHPRESNNKSHSSSNIQTHTHGTASRQSHYPNRRYHAAATCAWSCPLCKQGHGLYNCNEFNKMPSDAKLKIIHKLKVCKNCLYVHKDNICNSKRRCKVCQQNHSTILHDAFFNNITTSSSTGVNRNSIEDTERELSMPSTSKSFPTCGKGHNVNHVASDNEEILLATVSLNVQRADGSYIMMRALLDQGSQISLISENAAKMLGLVRQSYHASISGIGDVDKQSKGIVTINCLSIHDEYQFTTRALIINRLINKLPNTSFQKESWNSFNNILLADPEYNVSRPRDLLLDASVYSDIIMSGLIRGPDSGVIAQQTRMGWVLSGCVKTFICNVVVKCNPDLSHYWEMEEIQESSSNFTQEDQYCEDLYQKTTKRLADGRYEVAIPMKPQYESNLGRSKPKAIAQFLNMEQKMTNNVEFSASYKQFMAEYEKMNHMSLVKEQTSVSCYLPHHGVLKRDSSTTKLRTVFNASSKTTSGFSLNDLMERGPNLQRDLPSLILSWRQHKYVLCADIEKMFRTILIRPEDQHLQRIVWRNNPKEPIQEYQLRTITYGFKSAPFLAMRTLKQLAMDEAEKYPLASKALLTSFYMDDLLEGSSTIESAKQLQNQLINILQGAGMNIRKWSSNSPELIEQLSVEKRESPLDFKCLGSRKTLGLQWDPTTDVFTFQNKFENDTKEVETNITKRQLLSNISKIFDPLGWLSPLTIRAKLLFQQTWTKESLDWNEYITDKTKQEWIMLKRDFQNINIFKIPRYFGEQNNKLQIHGFCDASEKAYACVVYIVSKQYKGEYSSRLVTAKTKLAPLKNKVSLPRLELCGALLLSRLLKEVMNTLSDHNMEIHAWTDSMVVLGWIHGDINRWKPFIANRVQRIIRTIPSKCWHHVKSEDNAADCATRGLTLLQLNQHSLWWTGPEWLLTYKPEKTSSATYLPPNIETKKIYVHTALNYKNDLVIKLLNEYSSLKRIAKTLGWLFEFTLWLRNKKLYRRHNYLSLDDLNKYYDLIYKSIQAIEFREEIQLLQNNKAMKKGSKLICLNPYLDTKDGLLKVGGRLSQSHLSGTAKHPIILPKQGRLTELVIQQAHMETCHGGPKLTLAHLREKFWILSGLRTVKREVRKCIKCCRYRKQTKAQMMSDLPKPRVTPSRPFSHTGVDFTGHFDVKANKGRGIKTCKCYVAVFVCLATKAVHLELVSDLSTHGFLAAFRRFCARRGSPCIMYSDNGTNFVGANKLLKKEYQEIHQTLNETLLDKMTDFKIKWRFI